jgi:hypothetical protein
MRTKTIVTIRETTRKKTRKKMTPELRERKV